MNGIFGQSYRPEFRFINEFCDADKLRTWLDSEGLERIVVVEDMVGTGQQFLETIAVLTQLGKETLFVQFLIFICQTKTYNKKEDKQQDIFVNSFR